MKVTKEQVITALKTEPLEAGQFIVRDGGSLNSCPVCAVGAVMRNVINSQIEDADLFTDLCERATLDQYISGDYELLISEGNYLGALSNYFEDMMSIAADEYEEFEVQSKHRDQLINFVNEKFPAEFEIEYNKE